METLFWGKRRLGWFVLIENLFVLVSVDVWKCLLLKMGQNPFETFETQTTHANRQISMTIDRFQNKSKSWIFWSLVRGVWDDFGWYKSCFYCPRLMFGWLWDYLLLNKVDLGQLPLTHLPPTSQQTILPWPDIMIGTDPGPELGSAIFHLLLCHLLAQTT